MSRITQPWVEQRAEHTPEFAQHGKDVLMGVLVVIEAAAVWYLLTGSGTL